MSANKITLECPFDLEAVFTLQYSTDGLKGVLKWIIDNLGDLNKNVVDLNQKLTEKLKQVDKNKDGVAKNADDIALLKKMIKELENKAVVDENRVDDMNVRVENLNMNVTLQHRTVMGCVEDHKELIDQHTAEIEELKKKSNVPMPEIKGDGLDMGELMKMFAMKSPPDSTIDRIEELEKQMKDAFARLNKQAPTTQNSGGPGLDQDALDKLNDLLHRVQSLETRAGQTDSKLQGHDDNLADHERRIKALESMDMGGPTTISGEVDTAAILKQVNMVKQEFVTFKEVKHNQDLEALRIEMRGYTDKEVSECSQVLSNKIDSSIEAVKYEQDRLRAEFENFKNRDFKDLEARVTALEKKFQRLNEAFANLKMPEASGGGVSEEAFRQLEARVNDLENMLRDLQNEFARWIKEFQDSLNTKADFAQMDKALQDRLSDIVKALTKQFADKAETRKAFKIHEKQFQNLYNLIRTMGGGGENEEDAMFSKKPLGGMSCASCEKGLVDMYGKRVEFMPWNKLPFRDPSERIARVGQGFSKMLSMINPDQLSRYEQQNSKMAQNQQQMHMSQNDPVTNQQEQFYDPNGQGNNNMGGRTHTRFPQANQRFTTSDGKRPGSAQQRKAMRSKQRKM